MADRTALVTGASSGIGRAIAVALAGRGAGVWLVGRDAEELEATRSLAGTRSEARSVDLTDDESMLELAAEAAGVGVPDVLVHCAGVISLGRMDSLTLADFDAQWHANVRAAYGLTQALLPALRRNEGEVVFVNSSSALTPRAGNGQFSATEAAVRAVADSLRDEVNTDGIRVLSVFPGRTATPRQERIHAGEGRDYLPQRLMQPDDVAAAVLTALELPRSAEITDIHMRPFLKPL